MQTEQIEERQHARVKVRLGARFTLLDREQAEELEEQLLEKPSVWTLSSENELMKLADGSQSGDEALLAGAILDLCRQVERLGHRQYEAVGPSEVGTVVQLSGGGMLFSTQYHMKEGDLLDIRLLDETMEAPPIRALAEIVHQRGAPPNRYGLRFNTIHPLDKERLIRYIYQLQRRELRRASLEKA
jgi:hypothetical protein